MESDYIMEVVIGFLSNKLSSENNSKFLTKWNSCVADFNNERVVSHAIWKAATDKVIEEFWTKQKEMEIGDYTAYDDLVKALEEVKEEQEEKDFALMNAFDAKLQDLLTLYFKNGWV